jgi:hypothetical protein
MNLREKYLLRFADTAASVAIDADTTDTADAE